MIRNFSSTLDVQGKPQKFDFVTMNTDELQLFQVYTDWEGARVRFHMQRDKDATTFVIKDPAYCPAPVQALEAQLSETILGSQAAKA